jgi:hypothetical protein
MLELAIAVAILIFAGLIIYQSRKDAKEIQDELLGCIKQQQDFIDKNINERVVFTTPELGYTNAHKFEKEEATIKDEEETIEIGAEELDEINNPKKSEGNK